MNFAKKTMSLALASVMAASSLFVGTTAFAATDKVITPMTGNTQAVTAVVKDTLKDGYHRYEVESPVYSYTPATSGYYAISLAATPIYETKTEVKTEYGTDTKYVYSYAAVNNTSERVDDDAYLTMYDNADLVSNSSTEYVSTDRYSVDYTVAKDEDNYEYLKSVDEYVNGYKVVKLTAGKTYYLNVNTDYFYNNVENSTTGERTYFSGATLTVAPTDWTYNETVKYTTKKYTVNGQESERRVKTSRTASTGYVGTAKDAVVPDAINGATVNSFVGTNNEAITSLTLSANVKKVDGMSNLKKLAAVNLANVETIYPAAFAGDTALTSVVIPATVKTIGNSAFSGCTALANVTISNGVKSIGDYAFYETALKSAVIPASVNEIGEFAFGYVGAFDENTAAPYDTTAVAKPGFVMAGYSSVEAAKYAQTNGFAYYDITNGCPHPYEVTTVAATVFAKGSQTSVCPICGNTVVKSLKKKTFKISSVKSSKKKTIVVKAKKQNEMAGYQVQYSTSKKFAKKSTKTAKVATKKALNKTVKGLKSGKKYYVRVRAYKVVNGKTVYSSWTAKKSVKVK